ncbi:hypothetical protein Tco_0525270 [Tanacetum coccineum]
MKLVTVCTLKFWHDIWIGDQKLCCVFPRLFALEEDKDCYVASKFHGSVDLSFRRAVRGGVEAQQFAQLRDMLDTESVAVCYRQA